MRLKYQEELKHMCLSCGCCKLNDDHGNAAHITMQDLEAAAKAAGITPEQAADNIAKGHRQASKK